MGHSLIFSYTIYTIKSLSEIFKMPKGSGLTKPLTLSKELADLIGAKKDEKLSRPEVVKRIWAYLKEKKLQDPENNNFSHLTLRCSPSLARRRSAPSAWRSISKHTLPTRQTFSMFDNCPDLTGTGRNSAQYK